MHDSNFESFRVVLHMFSQFTFLAFGLMLHFYVFPIIRVFTRAFSHLFGPLRFFFTYFTFGSSFGLFRVCLLIIFIVFVFMPFFRPDP